MASGPDVVVEDAVHASVVFLRGLGEAIRKGDRLGDGDAMLDLIEHSCTAISHLRSGAGSVQLNVEALEQKITEEVLGMQMAINAEAASETGTQQQSW